MKLKDYCDLNRGAQTLLGKAVGVPSQLVWQWCAARPIPQNRCPALEAASGGQMTCEDLRPDVAWHRIPDPDWPWHPAGRPLIDVARGAAANHHEELRNAA